MIRLVMLTYLTNIGRLYWNCMSPCTVHNRYSLRIQRSIASKDRYSQAICKQYSVSVLYTNSQFTTDYWSWHHGLQWHCIINVKSQAKPHSWTDNWWSAQWKMYILCHSMQGWAWQPGTPAKTRAEHCATGQQKDSSADIPWAVRGEPLSQTDQQHSYSY